MAVSYTALERALNQVSIGYGQGTPCWEKIFRGIPVSGVSGNYIKHPKLGRQSVGSAPEGLGHPAPELVARGEAKSFTINPTKRFTTIANDEAYEFSDFFQLGQVRGSELVRNAVLQIEQNAAAIAFNSSNYTNSNTASPANKWNAISSTAQTVMEGLGFYATRVHTNCGMMPNSILFGVEAFYKGVLSHFNFGEGAQAVREVNKDLLRTFLPWLENVDVADMVYGESVSEIWNRKSVLIYHKADIGDQMVHPMNIPAVVAGLGIGFEWDYTNQYEVAPNPNPIGVGITATRGVNFSEFDDTFGYLATGVVT